MWSGGVEWGGVRLAVRLLLVLIRLFKGVSRDYRAALAFIHGWELSGKKNNSLSKNLKSQPMESPGKRAL